MRKHIAGEDVSQFKKNHVSYPFAINNEQ